MSIPGVISAIELYTLPEAKRRLRLGRHTFRQLRSAGLNLLKIGRCYYVDGGELIATMKKIGSANEPRQ